VQFLIRINSLKLGNSNKTTNLSFTLQTVLGKIIRHLKIVISFYLSPLENGVLLSNLWPHSQKHRYGDENVKVLPSRCRPECSVNIFITISNVRLVVNSNLSSIFLRR